jgi:hypothetical protein
VAAVGQIVVELADQPLQLGHTGQAWVERGQVRGEVVEPAGGAGNRVAGMGRGQPVEVSNKCRSQPRATCTRPAPPPT